MTYFPGSGSTPTTALSIARAALNTTGTTIPKFMPVKIVSDGMHTIDPSIETDMDSFAGLTSSTVVDGGNGYVVSSGLISDIGVWSVGDSLYVSKSGGVTNIKPSAGLNGWVAGDFIIFLGLVVPNANPALVDCLVAIQRVGQLA